MDAQDLGAPTHIGDAQRDLAVEAPRSANRGIEGVGLVCGADEDDLPARGQAVHQGEQLSYDTPLDLPARFGPFRGQGVQFVDEDDAGCASLGLLEDSAQPRFALAIEFIDDLGSVDDEKGRVGLRRYDAGDQCFTGAGRSVEQDSLGRLDAQAVKDGWIFQWQLDHLADALYLFAQSADIFVPDASRCSAGGPARLRPDKCPRLHQHRFDVGLWLGRLFDGQFACDVLMDGIVWRGRRGADDEKFSGCRAGRSDAQQVPDDDRQPDRVAGDVLQVGLLNRRSSAQWQERDLLGGAHLRFAYGDGFSQAGCAVLAHLAVHLYRLSPTVG